ncbi:MAG: AgmX/PglI C-terminal domain-containing protein, partial [Gemmatimonadaceae bacterium]
GDGSVVPAFGGSRQQLPRDLRIELLDAEDRSLLWSYAASATLGAAWLALVMFGPVGARLIPHDPIDVSTVITALVPSNPVRSAIRTERAAAASGVRSVARVEDAFLGSTSSAAVRVASVLHNLETTSGSPVIDRGSKVVLAAGSPAGDDRARNDTRLGPGLRDASLGGVRDVKLDAVTVTQVAPPSMRVSPIPGAARDVAALGDVVRGNQGALNNCYVERGLKLNPTLGGTVRMRVDIGVDGRVTGAAVSERSWAGAGAGETEQCLRESVERWRFPASSAASSSAFVLSFTR